MLVAFTLAVVGATSAWASESAWFCRCGSGAVHQCGEPSTVEPLRLDAGCFAVTTRVPPEGGAGLEVATAGTSLGLEVEMTMSTGEPAEGRWENVVLRPLTHDARHLELREPLSSAGYDTLTISVRAEGEQPIEITSVRTPIASAVAPVQGSVLRATHRTRLRVRPSEVPIEYWMPLPGLMDYQVPLTVQLYSSRPDVVLDRKPVEDSLGNWGVVLTLAQQSTPTDVELGWDAVVIVRRYPLPSIGSVIAEAPPRAWLEPTATVQVGSRRITDATRSARTDSVDAEQIIVELLAWKALLFSQRRGWSGHPPWWVDAESVLRRRRATCTGSANLVTSVARTAGIPTRLIAGLTLEEPLQTHFLVESWLGPQRRWRLYESQWTQAFYPRDSFVTLRIVHPDDEGPQALVKSRFAAPGVPWKSRDEVLTGWGSVSQAPGYPGLAGCRECDNHAWRVAELRSSEVQMEEVFDIALHLWRGALGRAFEKGEFPPAIDAILEATTQADVVDGIRDRQQTVLD